MLHAHDPNSPIKPKYLVSETVTANTSSPPLINEPTQNPYVNNNISFGHHVQQQQQLYLNNHHVALQDQQQNLVSAKPLQHNDHQRYHRHQQFQQPVYEHQPSNHTTNGNSIHHRTPCNAQFPQPSATGHNSALIQHLHTKNIARNQQPPRHSQQHQQPADTPALSGNLGITENDHVNVSASGSTVRSVSETENKNHVNENSLHHQQREQSQVQTEMVNTPPSPPVDNSEEHSERLSSQQLASFMSHHDAVCGHLYQTGFLSGLFSDVTVIVPNLLGGKAYNLHSLVLARSPLLFRLLTESSTRGEITLSFDDPNISEDGLAIAIGHLYAGYSQHLVHPLNATGVLAAAYLLDLDDLASIASERIKADINRSTILWYVRFVGEESPAYGRYTTEIRDVCFQYITKILPREMQDYELNKGAQSSRRESVPSSPNGKTRSTLSSIPINQDITAIFVALPFHWLKSAIESPQFCISSDMKRYQFAQNVISMREKIRSMRVAKGEIESGGEESVVLSFGRSGSNGRTITVVRKPMKGSRMSGRPERVLWKVPT